MSSPNTSITHYVCDNAYELTIVKDEDENIIEPSNASKFVIAATVNTFTPLMIGQVVVSGGVHFKGELKDQPSIKHGELDDCDDNVQVFFSLDIISPAPQNTTFNIECYTGFGLLLLHNEKKDQCQTVGLQLDNVNYDEQFESRIYFTYSGKLAKDFRLHHAELSVFVEAMVKYDYSTTVSPP